MTKDELLEASKVSDDISALNFSKHQLENLVDGLIGIGDKNGDFRITFDEYVQMSHDVFVNNFAPRNLKRVLRSWFLKKLLCKKAFFDWAVTFSKFSIFV